MQMVTRQDKQNLQELKDLKKAHENLKINDVHFNVFKDILVQTLKS